MPGSNSYSTAPSSILNDASPHSGGTSVPVTPAPAGETAFPWAVLASVAAAVISYTSTRQSARESAAAYDKQVKDNIAQWNRENEYNTPAAQMQRFMQAGLNPDLIYGQSNTSGSTQVAPEQMNVPNYGSILNGAMGNVVSSIEHEEMKDAQVELLRSQATKNYSDVESSSQLVQQKWKELELKDKELAEFIRRNGVLDDLDDARRLQVLDQIQSQQKERELLSQQIKESISRVNLNDVQKNLTQKRVDSYAKELAASLREAYSRAGLNDELALKASKEADDIVQTRFARMEALMSQAHLNDMSADEKVALKNKLAQETERLIQDLYKHQWESSWYKSLLNDNGRVNYNPGNLLFLSKYLISGIIGISL